MRGPSWAAALLALAVACPWPVAGQGAPGGVPLAEVGLLALPGVTAGPAAAGLSSLLAAVVRRTSIEVSTDAPAVLDLLDPRLFEHPLVFASGTGDVRPLDDGEADALRRYLLLGGMLILDDASGAADSAFAAGARRELSRVLGGRPFVRLPDEHAVFRSYYLLDGASGRHAVDSGLEALLVEGRAAVVLSRNHVLGAAARDEFGAWLLDVRPGGSGQRELAVRTGVNLVMYSMTLDYKEDLVHLPLILERRR